MKLIKVFIIVAYCTVSSSTHSMDNTKYNSLLTALQEQARAGLTDAQLTQEKEPIIAPSSIVQQLPPVNSVKLKGKIGIDPEEVGIFEQETLPTLFEEYYKKNKAPQENTLLFLNGIPKPLVSYNPHTNKLSYSPNDLLIVLGIYKTDGKIQIINESDYEPDIVAIEDFDKTRQERMSLVLLLETFKHFLMNKKFTGTVTLFNENKQQLGFFDPQKNDLQIASEQLLKDAFNWLSKNINDKSFPPYCLQENLTRKQLRDKLKNQLHKKSH